MLSDFIIITHHRTENNLNNVVNIQMKHKDKKKMKITNLTKKVVVLIDDLGAYWVIRPLESGRDQPFFGASGSFSIDIRKLSSERL